MVVLFCRYFMKKPFSSLVLKILGTHADLMVRKYVKVRDWYYLYMIKCNVENDLNLSELNNPTEQLRKQLHYLKSH